MPPLARRLPSEESEVDIEVAEEVQETSEEEPEEEEEEGANAQQDELEDSEPEPEEEDEDEEESAPPPPPTPRPKLKIKLKLGPAPTPAPAPTAPTGRVSLGRAARRPPVVDVESEDEDLDDGEDEMEDSDDDEVDEGMTGLASGRLTARQAALAGVPPVPHTALPLPTSSRKRASSPSQIALRKEENARKRKNMIEKKLEDEKLETINRLLKKQTRPRGKRGPLPAVPTPAPVPDAPSDEERDVDMDAAPAEQGGGEEEQPLPTPIEPMQLMYRWLSTSRPLVPLPAAAEVMQVDSTTESDAEPKVSIVFCVPEAFLAAGDASASPILEKEENDGKGRCAVAGCGASRKYRVVGREWGIGACGIGHLKLLQAGA